MLAHKVNGDHPTSYSDLLLTAWKLERQNEARDPLLLKTTTTRRLNVTHSQAPLNWFPSWKLKGILTFTAQVAAVEGSEMGEDSDAKLNERRKLSLLQKIQKPPVVFVEQINWSATLPILLMQWSCTRRRPKTVLDVAVPTTSWEIVLRMWAKLPRRQV